MVLMKAMRTRPNVTARQLSFPKEPKHALCRNLLDPENAAYLTLNIRPITENAVKVGENLVHGLFKSMLRSGGRGRPPEQEKRAALISCLIGELLFVAKWGRGRWVRHGMSANDFSGTQFGYKIFRDVIRHLVSAQFLEEKRGSWVRESMFPSPIEGESFGEPEDTRGGLGRTSRWRVLPKLYTFCERNALVTPENVDQHFRFELPPLPLVLRKQSKLVKGRRQRGSLVKVPVSEITNKLQDQVRTINAYLADFTIAHPSAPELKLHNGFLRVFTLTGTLQSFAWNKNGRLHSLGQPNYQTIPKERRTELCIDGEEVVELDIRASFLTIYYARRGVPLDATVDPYAVEGLPCDMPWPPREVAKVWIVSVFGKGGLPSRWGTRLIDKYSEENPQRKLAEDFPLKLVQQAVLRRHPLLGSVATTGLNSLDLMFYESEVILSTMSKLEGRAIPSLPVHDSLIVRAQDAEVANEYLQSEYEARIGIRPYIRIKSKAVPSGRH
jgi:hypothetical protein